MMGVLVMTKPPVLSVSALCISRTGMLSEPAFHQMSFPIQTIELAQKHCKQQCMVSQPFSARGLALIETCAVLVDMAKLMLPMELQDCHHMTRSRSLEYARI